MAGRIEGLKELNDKLEKLSATVRGPVLRKALTAAAKPVVARARATIPTGTDAHYVWRGSRKGGATSGRLVAPGFASRSIKSVTRVSRDKNSAAALIGVKREAFYAVQFVELGTSKTPKQEWLAPALENTQSQSVAILADFLRKGIEKVAR